MDILKLRVLLCFLENNKTKITVTQISKILNEEKYKVSRILIGLENDGLVDRTNNRTPKLTDKGKKVAKNYSERVEIIINHLLYEGLDITDARNDALYWALYSSDEAMKTIRDTEERYRVKYELRNIKQNFSGALLCKNMKDGVYKFPFIIYKENVKNGNNISMANEGFEHTCNLVIKDGKGIIQMKAVNVISKSKCTNCLMKGKVKNMSYMDSGVFINAEKNGDILSFPADTINFVSIGNGVGQILHGSICIKITWSVDIVHMSDLTAILTILI